ncbi:MAG: pirin family protein [Chitinophagales bacterium]|nr:pirin family protein [Chitinophagales bacterium]
MTNTVFHPANERGHADHGWLNAHHSFSFAGYHDPSKIHFGALRVLNDDIVSEGMGFGKHPHDNMEIITVVLDGALEHKDSMGHTQAIHPNEVQVMSAGTGVFHSEYNHNRDKKVNLLQLWIFPNKRNVEPRYDQKLFAPEERVNNLQSLVSPIEGNDDGLKIHQDAWIYRTTLQAGKSVEHKLHSDKHGVYVFNITGSVNANGQLLNRRDAVGLSGTDTLTLSADAESDVLVIEVPMYN